MPAPTIASLAPYGIKLEEGKTYLWCACGRSSNQPFCDSSHEGSAFAPIEFRAERTGTLYLCGCKHTRTPPVCDSSHIDLKRKA